MIAFIKKYWNDERVIWGVMLLSVIIDMRGFYLASKHVKEVEDAEWGEVHSVPESGGASSTEV